MSELPPTDSLGEPAPLSGPLLDYSPKHPVQRDYSTAGGPIQHCTYCGTPLDPFLYFCGRCSTPYKSIVAVTGSVRPSPLTDGERVKRMAPHTWTVFWTFAAVVVFCRLMSLPFGMKTGETSLFYFLATLAIFITTVIFSCIHWRPLAAQFKTSGFLKWEAWAGIGLLVPLLAINFGIYMLGKNFLPQEMSDPMEGLSLPVGILVFCVFPAVTEEIAFRGLVQYWLEVSLTPGKALLLGSAMFAGLHLNLFGFPYLFTVGMLLAFVRRRTGSLYPGILIHFLHNLVVITCFRMM